MSFHGLVENHTGRRLPSCAVRLFHMVHLVLISFFIHQINRIFLVYRVAKVLLVSIACSSTCYQVYSQKCQGAASKKFAKTICVGRLKIPVEYSTADDNRYGEEDELDRNDLR